LLLQEISTLWTTLLAWLNKKKKFNMELEEEKEEINNNVISLKKKIIISRVQLQMYTQITTLKK